MTIEEMKAYLLSMRRDSLESIGEQWVEDSIEHEMEEWEEENPRQGDDTSTWEKERDDYNEQAEEYFSNKLMEFIDEVIEEYGHTLDDDSAIRKEFEMHVTIPPSGIPEYHFAEDEEWDFDAEIRTDDFY